MNLCNRSSALLGAEELDSANQDNPQLGIMALMPISA